MKHVIIGLAVASLAAGMAYAGESGNLKMPDADGDGVVTRAEMQAHAAQMFAHIDVNGDGKIDEADRVAMQAQRFDRMDTDKNGQISREEFEAAHPMRDGPMSEGQDRASEHGLEPGAGKQGAGRHHGGDRMMLRTADANKDGAVSEAEYTAAMLKPFDKADANHDGKVTKEEWQAAFPKMHGRMGHGDCPMKPAPAE